MWQDLAISIAVSSLSPVSIKNLTSAFINFEIVVETPSYSLSSMAEHPIYLRFDSILSNSENSYCSLLGPIEA